MFLGFIGDLFGYKSVLIYALVSTAVTQTLFLFLPPYTEINQAPYAILVKQNRSDVFQLQHLYWPLCNAEVTDDNCAQSQPFQDEEFANVSYYWSCSNSFDYSFNNYFQLSDPTSIELLNGTFCHANSTKEIASPELAVICYIQDSYAASCQIVDGNHALTFWLYFLFYCIYALGMNSAYSLQDSTALHLVNQHNSDYSYVFLWNFVGAAVAPIITALTVKEPEEGGSQCDF